MGNFSAQEIDDVVTMENNWKVQEHARQHWRDSSSNLLYYKVWLYTYYSSTDTKIKPKHKRRNRCIDVLTLPL